MYVLLEYFNRALYINVWGSVIQTIHLSEHFYHCLRTKTESSLYYKRQPNYQPIRVERNKNYDAVRVSECRTQLNDKGSMLNFFIAIICISKFILGRFRYQLFRLTVTFSFMGAPVLQPRYSCME